MQSDLMSPLGTLEIPNNRKIYYQTHRHPFPMYCLPLVGSTTPRSIPIPNTNNTTLNNTLTVNNDPLLKLMSISLANDRGPVALNGINPPKSPFLLHNNPHNHLLTHSHKIIRPDSATSCCSITSEMLLKSGHLPGGSPIPIPSPNSIGSGHPESPKSTADTGITPPLSYISNCTNNNCNNNDDDEVLSIGKEDDHQQMILDCDSSTVLSDQEDEMGQNDTKNIGGGSGPLTNGMKDYHNNHHHNHHTNSSLGDRLRDNQSQGSSSNISMKSMNMNELLEDDEEASQDDDDQSSQNSSEMGGIRMSIRSQLSRNRKYSSEDSFTIKSLCSPTPNYHHNNNSNETTTSTASPPPPQSNGSNNSANNNHNPNRHSSLLFSIANILRPDFGLCNNNLSSSNSNNTNNMITNPFLPAMHNINNMMKKSLKTPQGIDFNYSTSTKRSSSHHHNHSRHHSGNNSSDSTKSRSSQAPRQPQQQSLTIINPIDLSRPSSTGVHNHHHQRNHNQISSPVGTGHNNNSTNNRHSSSKKLKLNNESTKGSLNDNGGGSTSGKDSNASSKESNGDGKNLWPAWVYCTRYSDRPSSGPRTRRERKNKAAKEVDEKRPRTAFTAEQLARLKKEFEENRYLTEKRRQDLARELRLHENQIKIWFQNKRAKLKKASGQRGGLALQLMAQGLYNHSTIPKGDDEDSSD